MKVLLIAVIFLFFIGQAEHSQNCDLFSKWSWIIPMKTTRDEVEKVFGTPITSDKSAPFQTFEADFGKINVAFAPKTGVFEDNGELVKKGTALNYYVSLRKRIRISEVPYDLSKFEKDATYSPREISYTSKDEDIMIASEIIQTIDGKSMEQVFALEYRPKAKKSHRK